MRINIKFLQTDGVPLTNDLMDTLQEAFQIFSVIGDMAGNLTILSGCEITGSTVAPGVVAIDGDVLRFEGGLISDTVYIETEQIRKTFENQTDKVLIEKKTVKFGNALTTYNWSEFVKLDTIKELMAKINNGVTIAQYNALLSEIELLKLKTAPIINGGIIFPFRRPANEIPTGWKECIDFRGKTIVGRDPNDTDFANLGNTVGTKTHTLSINEMPDHDHDYDEIGNNSVGGVPGPPGGYDGGNNRFHIRKLKTTSKGGNQPHNNIQPSRIVNYIEPNFQ